MNEIVNKFLLEGNKLVPEMHLRQPGFIEVWNKILRDKHLLLLKSKSWWISMWTCFNGLQSFW